MVLVTASIEIAAPPSVVREKFLDFPTIPKYHPNGFFLSLTSLSPEGTFNVGEKMRIQLRGMDLEATIVENSPTTFCWGKSIPFVVTAEHAFYFLPSEENPGSTTFTQKENFSGPAGWIMGLWMSDSTSKNWEGYNKDLKAWCETGKVREID